MMNKKTPTCNSFKNLADNHGWLMTQQQQQQNHPVYHEGLKLRFRDRPKRT